MIVRRPTEADRGALAAFAAPLQVRPEHHVAYLGDEPDVIAAEMIDDVADWTEAAAVVEVAVEVAVEDPLRIIGWLMGSIDHEMGRVWWFGPFVDARDPTSWCDVADRLAAEAQSGLPGHVREEEYAFDARHLVGGAWAVARGFVADPGSAVLTLDHRLDHRLDQPTLAMRPVTPADADTVASLHDELFPNTHTTGAALVASTDPRRIRLVAERDGEVAGYIAVERQAGGAGYIDFLGVAPAFRRNGIGAQLVRAGVAALAGLGCNRFDLTVRETNDGARALYTSLGFVEERIVRPFRRGFLLP